MAGKPLATWSGFAHQGRAALIAAFDFIAKRMPEDGKLQDYVLALEEEEDFLIKRGELKLEFHQVKVRPDDFTYYYYKDAAKSLMEREPANARKFLHTYSKISNWPSSNADCELYMYNGSDGYFGKSDPQAVQVGMNLYLQKAISEAMGKFEINGVAIEMIMHRVEAELNNAVCNGHTVVDPNNTTSEGKFRAEIRLDKLLDQTKISKSIENFKLREILEDAVNDFFDFKQCSTFKEAPEEHRQRLNEFIYSRFLTHDLEQFKEILENLNPQYSRNPIPNWTSHRLYTPAGWKDVFLQILTRVVKQEIDLYKEVLPNYKKFGEFFVPTFISEDNPAIDKIRNNVTYVLPFEADHIIIKRLPEGGPSRESNIVKIDEEVEGFSSRNTKDNTSVSKPKTPNFISMDDAINILNQ